MRKRDPASPDFNFFFFFSLLSRQPKGKRQCFSFFFASWAMALRKVASLRLLPFFFFLLLPRCPCAPPATQQIPRPEPLLFPWCSEVRVDFVCPIRIFFFLLCEFFFFISPFLLIVVFCFILFFFFLPPLFLFKILRRIRRERISLFFFSPYPFLIYLLCRWSRASPHQWLSLPPPPPQNCARVRNVPLPFPSPFLASGS